MAIDPKKQGKYRGVLTSESGTMTGSAGTLVRDRSGNLKSIRDKNFAGQRNDSMAVDRKVASGSSNGTYGGVAPRVGGIMKKSPGKVVSYGKSSALKKKNIGRLKKRGSNF